jgi:protein O-GlcNAc transferase
LNDPAADRLSHAKALHRAGRLAEADRAYREILGQAPDHPGALEAFGVLALQTERYPAAAEAFSRLAALQPGRALPHNHLGLALRKQGRLADALAAFERAVRAAPGDADAHANRAATLQDLGRLEDAVSAYQTAARLRPGWVLAHNNLATALRQAGQPDEAVAAFARAAELAPDDPTLQVYLWNEKRHLCSWDGLEAIEARVLNGLDRPLAGGAMFPLLALTTTAAQLHRAAQAHARHFYARYVEHAARHPFPFNRGPRERITVGYLSADFREHAVARTAAGIFERHDRDAFRVHGYAIGPDDGSALRRRIVAAFDRFTDLTPLPPAEAAARIHADGVDILVDLTGYTTHARTAIPALRPAPVQVNYLGYIGTLGADFVDYVIADAFAAPSDWQPWFTEALVHLPDCYQPHDADRAVSPDTPDRAACGLPPEGTVFCCFNTTYKIGPEVFGAWMRVLKAVPGSVLWLAEPSRWAVDNLRAEARGRGVAPERLVFAPRLAVEEYVARYRVADLFLDTHPYSAGATADDALRMGCPVLTRAGETFVSRMSASQVRAAGVPELVTGSLEEYEARAIELGRDGAARAALRERLATNRETAPLFDTERYVRHLEDAYRAMWASCERGESPAPITVPPR